MASSPCNGCAVAVVLLGALACIVILLVATAQPSPLSQSRPPTSPPSPSSRECRDVRSSQLHGPISNAQAAELIRRVVGEPKRAASPSCPLLHDASLAKAPRYVSWRPNGTGPRPKWGVQPHHHQQHHPDFHPSLYASDETNRIAQLIYDHQNPRDCSKAKFLVLTREWHSGLGSNIHVKAWMLLVAIMTNRVLVDSPNIKWNMTNPLNCAQQDWTCYFAPVSKCALAKDWDESQVPEFATEDLDQMAATSSSPRQHVRTIAHPQPLNGALIMGQSSVNTIQGFGGSSTFNNKPNSWWMTHATNYLIRPNKRTLNVACWYWSCMPIQFDRSSQQQLTTTASIFVRSGDKWKEANLRTAQEHFDALEHFVQLNPDLRPSTVYFGTDDALVLSEVARQFSHKYNLTWIGVHRDTKGLTFEETMTRAYSSKVEWQVLVSLSDLYISSLADIFVGTLSSNWCRLADELRKAHGKATLPYLTPEGEPLIAGV